MNKLDRVPDKLKEQIFDKLFATAEIARFTPDQVRSYEDSLKYYRDLKKSLDTARDEGKIEGKIEVAKNLLKNGIPIDLIVKSTGLSEKEIKGFE
jgi:predicted transposase/invertase (TIGR01784 family)